MCLYEHSPSSDVSVHRETEKEHEGIQHLLELLRI